MQLAFPGVAVLRACKLLSEETLARCLRKVWFFRSIIEVIVSRSSSPEVCHVHSGSLEASRSRVGIAERDDILWLRCVVGT